MRGYVCSSCGARADVVVTATGATTRPRCLRCDRPLTPSTAVALRRDLRRAHEHDERENLPPDGGEARPQ